MINSPQIRKAISITIKENNIGKITEMLKWDEQSYLAQGSSIVRMDWRPKFPEQTCVHFYYQTILTDAFNKIYKEVFSFKNNRVIALPL